MSELPNKLAESTAKELTPLRPPKSKVESKNKTVLSSLKSLVALIKLKPSQLIHQRAVAIYISLTMVWRSPIILRKLPFNK